MRGSGENKIAFRVDSSSFIGIGHIKRCLNIAKELEKIGIQSIFICRNFTDNNYQDIIESGFKLILLNRPIIIPQENKDETKWLCVEPDEDANETLNQLSELNCKLVFVDHYGICIEWETQIKNNDIKLIVLDDLNRKHNTDILVDYSFWKKEKNFFNITNNDCLKLVGKDYMPLSKDFKNISPKHKNFLNLTILISFGGFDLEGLTLKTVHALKELNKLNINKVIIISNKYSERKIQELLDTVSFAYQLHISPSSLGFAYAESDICIGSSGVSSFERAYFEIPQLIFVKAHNQVETAKNLSQRNMAVSVCNFMQSNVTSSIESFINVKNLNKIHKNLKNFINLNGSSKIANEIKILLNTAKSTYD